jgi:hypothetical protein
MGAAFAAWKVDNIALLEFSPAGWPAKARSTREDYHHLLLGEVVVIGVGRMSGSSWNFGGDPHGLMVKP